MPYVSIGAFMDPAVVVALDVKNDLAILRVPSALNDSYALTETIPRGGDSIMLSVYTVGGRAVLNGTFQKKITIYETSGYHITAPVNPGMSGSPVLDSQGRVIGVVRAKRVGSEGIAFVVPSANLIALMERARASKLRTAGEVLEERFRQLDAFQAASSEAIIEALSRPRNFYGYKVIANTPLGDRHTCTDRIPSYLEIGKVEQTVCQDDYSVSTDGRLAEGNFRISYRVEFAKSRQFVMARHASASATKEDWRPWTSPEENSLTTKAACESNIRRDSNSIPLLVSFCLRGYKKRPYVDAEISVSTLDLSKSVLVARMELKTFRDQTAKKLMQSFVDSIAEVKADE